jgi:Tol biopolymer transport system component
MRRHLVSLAAAAAAVPVAPALATAPAENGQIAFRRFFDDAHRRGAIFLINPDGTGERQLTHPPAGSIDAKSGAPSFTPDGSKLVFTRERRRRESLWTVNIRDGRERRLTPADNSDYDHGVYSPDGRRIAFGHAGHEHGRFRVSLNVMAADGTHVRRLVDLDDYKGGDLGRVDWSPDGRRIVYEIARGGGYGPGPHALFVIAARGRRAHLVGPWRKAEFDTLDWSPDGSRLLIQLKPLDGSSGGDYYTLRPDGSGLTRLTQFGTRKTIGAAAWSPDGKSIVFANAGVAGNDDIYAMRADGSAITPVTQTQTWESAPAWGPAR